MTEPSHSTRPDPARDAARGGPGSRGGDRRSCHLWVGTSGYSYQEWVDAGFYPRGARPAGMLALYAEHFPITELNYTWYQMPRPEAVDRQRRQAPPGFLFTAKLSRTLTHEVDPERWPQEAAAYRRGVAPLAQAGQLVAVLVQLPYSFDRSPSHRRHLAELLDELEGLPLAVEFRNAQWAHDRVFAELERRQVSLVALDEPPKPGLFPALDVVTNPDLLYVRFHGRNSQAWYSGRKEAQFDYDYADDELDDWVERRLERMARRARRGAVFFNNHVRAQAPRNALRLAQLMRQRGFTVMG